MLETLTRPGAEQVCAVIVIAALTVYAFLRINENHSLGLYGRGRLYAYRVGLVVGFATLVAALR